MASDLKSFLDGFVGTDRADEVRRIAFAGWLEDQDDPVLNAWSEYIRLQMETSKLPFDSPKRKVLIAEEKALWEQHHTEWGKRFIETLELDRLRKKADESVYELNYNLNPAWITYDRGIPDLAYRQDGFDNYQKIVDVGYAHYRLRSVFIQDQDHPHHKDVNLSIEMSYDGLRPVDAATIKTIVSSGVVENSLQLAQLLRTISIEALLNHYNNQQELLEAAKFALDYGPDATERIKREGHLGHGCDALGALVAFAGPMFDDFMQEPGTAIDAPLQIPHPQILQLLLQAGCRPVHTPDQPSPLAVLQDMVARATPHMDEHYWPRAQREELRRAVTALQKLENQRV